MGFEYAANAPAAHGVALGLHFGAEPAGAVALTVVEKHFAHGDLLGRIGCQQLLAALPGIVRSRGHA